MLSRYVSLLKSLTIVALAALSVFFTVQLWLVNIPNNSFFPYLRARFAPAAPDGALDFVRPFRIISGGGSGYFHIMYNNIDGSAQWVYGESVIRALLQNGSFVGRTETNFQHVLEEPVLIYEYAFHMDAVTFAQALQQRTGAINDAGITSFRAIAVNPPQNPGEPLKAFFICNYYTWEFTLAPAGRQMQQVFYGFDIPPPLHPERAFAATENTLVFTPRFHEDFSYHPLSFTNPYHNHAGLLELSFIRRQVEQFFDNPATINIEVVNYIYTFSNLNTVVRYLPWDVIEYTSFRTIGHATPTNLISDFSAALAFVNADANITNEFYLAGYEQHGRRTVFWFNYVIEDFPMVLPSWYTGPGTVPLPYPIEVSVERGRVIRYRKIPYTFAADTTFEMRLLTDLEEGAPGFLIDIRSNRHIRLREIHNGQGG